MNLNETIIYVIRRIGWPGLSCGFADGGGARGHNAKFELNIATLAGWLCLLLLLTPNATARRRDTNLTHISELYN